MSTTATDSVMEMRQYFGALLNRVQYACERFIVARQGKPVAALIRWEALQQVERLDPEPTPRTAAQVMPEEPKR